MLLAKRATPTGGLITESCFRKENSDPPICGVHNVPLVRRKLSVEMIGAGFEGSRFLVCPVSGQVIDDEATH